MVVLAPHDSNVVSTRKSIDCLACCICHCSASFRQDHGFDPPCGSSVAGISKILCTSEVGTERNELVHK